MHVPVLLKEVLEILEPKSGKVIVDGTIGSGGHAIPIIERLRPGGTFIGIDWDETTIENLESRIKNLERRPRKIVIKVGNYALLPQILKKEKIGKVDGVLLDLGFSSEQLTAGRGFSFNPPAGGEPLLMTYSKDSLPAYQVLKQLREKELEEIIRKYGEERYAGRIVRAISERERKKPITRSGELAEVIRRAVPRLYERGRINPATRTFMALRIYVNDELGNLEKFLESIPQVMAKRGRVAIITFHSLEDRIVKNHFRLLVKEDRAKLLFKKPITPDEVEKKINPRSRSAKLRAIELITNN